MSSGSEDDAVLAWRDPVTDEKMFDLVLSHGGNPECGWWDKIRPHSLGWATARTREGTLIGFVNVAWDGSDHAFLIDPKTRGSFQRRRIGTHLVRLAVEQARTAGCVWLHVGFEPHLRAFYFDACEFTPTDAGLMNLRSN